MRTVRISGLFVRTLSGLYPCTVLTESEKSTSRRTFTTSVESRPTFTLPPPYGTCTTVPRTTPDIHEGAGSAAGVKPLSLADRASFSCATTPSAALLSFRAALNFLRALTVSGSGVVLLARCHGCDSTCREEGFARAQCLGAAVKHRAGRPSRTCAAVSRLLGLSSSSFLTRSLDSCENSSHHGKGKSYLACRICSKSAGSSSS